ncbi:MAG: PPC domain-containing protein [Planctomycetes bacterium]|nr:PPC domain-containing protein [Planctomycetota bacterium]
MFQRRIGCLAICLLFTVSMFLSSPFAAAKGTKTDDKKKEPAKQLLNKSDQLTENDERDTHKDLTKSPRKVYKIKLSEGKKYQIDLKSTDFDAVLRLEDSAGKELAINDDFMAGSFDSRIVYAITKSGEYRIIATCLDGKPGKFTLTVVEAPAGTTVSMFAAKPTELKFKDGKASVAGELNDKSPVTRDHYYSVLTVKFEAGKTYRIDHRSDDFDAFLFLEDPLGNVLAQDDDSGGGFNARIIHKAAATGNYRIIATSLKAKETGKFSLEVVPEAEKKKVDPQSRLERSRSEPEALANVNSIAYTSGSDAQKKKEDAPKKKEEKKADGPTKLIPIQSKNDELKAGDPKDTKLTQSPRRIVPIELAAGITYQFDLKSKDFDAYLRLENAAGEEVAFNDDADLSTLDARIVYKAAKGGEYKIIVTSFDRRAGKFNLAIAEVTGKSTLQAGSRFQGKPIELTIKDGSATYTGDLTESDPTNYSHYYKLFTVKLEKGKTYRLDHRDAGKNPEFDPYLVLESPAGAPLATDDDSGGKLDARITYTATATGTYRIIATTLPRNQVGRFTLEITVQLEGTKAKNTGK